MNLDNLLLNTDSYKASHYLQYPPGTEYVSSYIESRGGAYPETLFFGLQIFLKSVLATPFTTADIDEAEAVFATHGEPFNRDGWEHILKNHSGRLPLRIQAVKEGALVPLSNVMVQVVNTDPAVPWLTSYMETALLRSVWYPTTVATRSHKIKTIIRRMLEETSDDPAAQIAFKLHDFGARGVSSKESAGIGGCAHLVNFMGSDTVMGVLYARRYYGEKMAAYSIPAAEHSTITAWGREREEEAYANMLSCFGGPGKLVAVVSDSYDIFAAARNIWGKRLKGKVEAMGGTLVVRPDSGDPTIVPVEIVSILAEAFGSSVNKKGYRVLAPCIRVIQGDGINEHSIAAILENLKAHGFAADNIVFGMGGELLQTMNRDTLKFAMKASAIKGDDGVWRDVYKDPVTDRGKSSKKGRLALVRQDGVYTTIAESNLKGDENLLEDVFLNGKLLRDQSLKEIRAISGTR